MHLIRPEKTIEVPARVGVGGLVTIKRRDMRTGKVDLVREEKPNMILQPMSDALIGAATIISQGNFVNWGDYTNTFYRRHACMNDCAIGSDGTAVQETDDWILTSLAESSSAENFARSDEFADPVWTSRMWTFPAGTGTGTVREVGVRQDSHQSARIPHTARQVVSPEIEKTEYHQLEITWKALFGRGTDHPWQTTKVGGQRDGTTDVTAYYEINDRQLMTWCRNNTRTGISGDFADDYTANPIGCWNGRGATPQIVVGASNTAGDLETDTDYTIQGTELFSGSVPMFEMVSRVAGSKTVESRMGLDAGDANGSIGEIVLCSAVAKSTSQAYGGLGRLRFDPPLDKVDNYRLFINVKFTFEDVNHP